MNIDINKIDIERLKNDLINHFYGLAYAVSPIAFMDVAKIEKADSEELIQIAIDNKFDLEKYEIKTRKI